MARSRARVYWPAASSEVWRSDRDVGVSRVNYVNYVALHQRRDETCQPGSTHRGVDETGLMHPDGDSPGAFSLLQEGDALPALEGGLDVLRLATLLIAEDGLDRQIAGREDPADARGWVGCKGWVGHRCERGCRGQRGGEVMLCGWNLFYLSDFGCKRSGLLWARQTWPCETNTINCT